MPSEQTRISLIKCMRALVRRKHFSSIKVEEICDLAHVSRRTFYRYFSDKYDLLRSVFSDLFFRKIEVADTDSFWDIMEKMCVQIYSEQDFFSHAFEVKGQNGFWDEAAAVLYPCMRKDYPYGAETDRECGWFVMQDIRVIFLLIEEWIHSGFDLSPREIASHIRACFAVHGKWIYQSAMGYEIEAFTMDKYENREW